MSKLFRSLFVKVAVLATVFVLRGTGMQAQQLPNANFENWNGATFDGKEQPASWNASNVEQVGFKFNFAHKETGHNGGYCMMVQDQDVGAAGITETSPGYFSLGQPWVYVESLTKINEATAGTAGCISWKYRPDSMSVWIKRTGNNVDKEDFYLLYYAWNGTARGDKYKGKNGKCTSVSKTDEESDVRLELNGNECGTTQKANQIAEGMWREKKSYGNWTNIRVPIYYFGNDVPTKMNIIFSASNYPNFRANSGLYAGNSLYVDDVEMIYSSRIQKLYIANKEWKGFDPYSTEIQTYSLGESATAIPEIMARRGVGSITNAHGTTVNFTGRELTGSEISIKKGDLDKIPTEITVTSEDGKSTTVYRIQFQRAPSTNAMLAGIAVNGEALSEFRPSQLNYNVELPYGTTAAPEVTYTLAEDGQTVAVTQATSPTGKATLVVTAPDPSVKKTYTLNFSVGKLKDNSLQNILVNGKSIPGFTPSQTIYKVSLPVGTKTLTVEPVSAYPQGEQTIEISPATMPTGEAINGSTILVSVSAPGNASVKQYKLNIKLEASSYSYLADLQIVGEQIADVNPAKPDDNLAIAFDPEQTIYYINLKMGTQYLPKILYTPGDEFQTIVTDTTGGIDGTNRVTVTAGNKSDQTVYKLVFSTAKSEVSTLAGIEIDGKPIEGFRPDSTLYPYELPIEATELPLVKPIPYDEFQKITPYPPTGLTGKYRISVTAGNGATTNYYIDFKQQQYKDNTLKSLTVDGYSLQDANYDPIAFDPQRNEYWVKLSAETEVVPDVHFELQNALYQDTVVRRPTSTNGDYKITVRPRNDVSRTYTIHFVCKKSSNTALHMIYLDGDSLVGFEPDKLSYTHVLDTGTTKMPVVTWDLAETMQKVDSAWENRTLKLTVFAQNNTKRTYKIKFIVPSSQSARLEMIYLGPDSMPLPGFRPDSMDYVYYFTGATCPKITVKKTPEQQVTITAPYAAGTAVIKINLEDGVETVPYTIEFIKSATATVCLKDILVNGVSVSPDGFNPAQTSYTYSYDEGTLPTVTYVKNTDSDQVQVMWKDSTAYLNVQNTEGDKVTYHITFTRNLDDDTTLEAIYADGVLIEGFNKTEHTYSYHLKAGSTYPEISYQASSEAQVIFFGQLEEGKWGITVVAENGDAATYTIQYTVAQYCDATLKNLSVEGYSIAFDPNTFEYALTIDDGQALPALTIEAREGQTIMQNNADETRQQIIVYAENGAHNTYIISYTRQLSSNALLADILIDGVSIEGFDPNKEDYVDTLARNTLVVPNVFPIGQLSTQTITTYFSRPDGVTKIEVKAQDGTVKKYSVAFPMRKSDNTELGDLYLNSDDVEIKFKPSQLDYEIVLPYEITECPKIIYEKAEPEQRIDVVSRPIGEVSEITVTAENGDTRTYSILFKRGMLKSANVLQSIYISEIDKELSQLKTKREYDVTLPYGARTLTIEYEKSYAEQTVFVEPGGIYHPTIITVKANNDTVSDVVYTINPIVTTQNPAVFDSIYVDGVALAEYDPNRFTYIVNRTATTSPKVKVIKASGVEYDYESSYQKWEATVTKDGYTNVYTLVFHYPNDVIPNGEFTNWSKTSKANSDKPTGWNAPGDYTSKSNPQWIGVIYNTSEPGKETIKSTASVVELKTTYWACLGGPIPAVLNIAQMTAKLAVAGGTNVTPSGFIAYHNTPDKATINYKYTSKAGDGGLFRFKFFDNEGVEHVYDHLQTSTKSNYADYALDLPTDGLNVNGLDIIIDASGQYPTASSDADLYVDYIRFSYNNTPKEAWVNGIKATLNGKVFTATMTDAEDVNLPSYLFKGEVSDQAQLLTWQSPKEEGDYSVRTATIRNYGEDGKYTDGYSLKVRRPLDTRNKLKGLYVNELPLVGFAADVTDYVVSLPSSRRSLPDVMAIPASSLQTVNTVYNEADSTMTITVTPEKGDATVYTVKFKTVYSKDVTLKSIVADGLTFDPETKVYELNTTSLPLISFDKQSDLQFVRLENGVLTVVAEDGVTTDTYTITPANQTVEPLGVIKEFEQNGNIITDLGGSTYSKEAAKPIDYISFNRAQASDSVIFVQDPEKMTWSVPGTSKAYTWTYPTALSSNAELADLLLDGTSYDDFDPSEAEYTITSDTTIVLTAVPAEQGQQLTTTATAVEGGVAYTTVVNAENGASKTYKVNVIRPKGSIATLAGIMLDDVMIDGFLPATSDYMVVLPAPQGAKTAQPKMPSVTYIAGQEGQKVTIETAPLGDQTVLTVESEDGSAVKYYYLTVKAEPSHCTDLTGISVNGEWIERFEPGRHFYSVSLQTEQIDIDYTSEDRYLNVSHRMGIIEAGRKYCDTLCVTAEDGMTISNYIIEIYVENQSGDAQLASILLDDLDFVTYGLKSEINRNIKPFDPGQNEYHINVKKDSIPSVSAQLKMDGQAVQIIPFKDSVFLNVTAVNGTKNMYKLYFEYKKSTNTALKWIVINDDTISSPTSHLYTYDKLKMGDELPIVEAEPVDGMAEVNIDNTKNPIVITVTPEDKTYNPETWNILCDFKPDTVKTLEMIYLNGKPLEGFNPNVFAYDSVMSPGETFPKIDYGEWTPRDASQWPYIDSITVSIDPVEHIWIHQTTVTAQDGSTNKPYILTFRIRKWDVDTLESIEVENIPLAGFSGQEQEYYNTFTPEQVANLNGRAPIIKWFKGEEHQYVDSAYVPDSYKGKSLGYKHVLTVKAENNTTRTYTVHYPVTPSSDATLQMINIDETPLKEFDPERNNYKKELEFGLPVPNVTAVTWNDDQIVKQYQQGDTVSIDVWAEDRTYNTYTIVFERIKSTISTLSNIIITDAEGKQFPYELFYFSPEEYEYNIILPYDPNMTDLVLPEMNIIKSDPFQTVEVTQTQLTEVDIEVSIRVIAPNGEDESEYKLTFTFTLNNDASLQGFTLAGSDEVLLFDENNNYTIKLAYGSDSTSFYTSEEVGVIKNDPMATDSIYMEDGVIMIVVTARDGKSQSTYTITQRISLDTVNTLKMIYIDGIELRGFDPEITDYVYLLKNGSTACPEVTAVSTHSTATVDITPMPVNDTTLIICTPQDSTDINLRKVYRIYFKESTVNDALEPTANDVFIKRVAGAPQLFVATIRKDVTFVLFDQNGHMLFFEEVPDAEPNSVQVDKYAEQTDILLNVDVDPNSGLLVDIIPGQIYFYSFVEAGKKTITSGKIMTLP